MTPHRTTSWLRLVIALAIAAVFVAPFVYMLIGSLSTAFTLTGTLDWRAITWTIANYAYLFSQSQLYVPLLNSLLVAAVVTLGNLLFCTLAGYVLARREFRGQKLVMLSVILVLMIPAHVVIIPMYLLSNWLGIFDTYLALI